MKITIEKIVYPGKSLGRGEDGLATFLDEGLPGEIVEADIRKKKRSFQEGLIKNIIQKSPLRQEPKCSSFGKCGGCSFQHTSYQNQLQLKEGYVRELLQPVTTVPLSPIVPSPEEWGYRNKMEFSFFEESGEVQLGLHQKGRFDQHLAVPPCFIADPDFLKIVEQVVPFARGSDKQAYNKKSHSGLYRHLVLRKGKRTGEILVNLVTNQDTTVQKIFFQPLVSHLPQVTSFYWTVNGNISDTVAADELHLLQGKAEIEEEMRIQDKSYWFCISPFSFFQTNSLGAEKLYETVLDLLEPVQADRLLDLYCGTGTIGLTLAPYVEQVWGIEQVPAAIENAQQNKTRNQISNIEFTAVSVEKWLKHGEIPDFNTLVLDPPRSGVSNKVLEFIEQKRPKKLVYVSCNPATLARDLQFLKNNVGYSIEKVVPVDMFPQTYHVEVVVRLSK